MSNVNSTAARLTLAAFAISVAMAFALTSASSSNAASAYFCATSSGSGGAGISTLPPNGSCTGIGNSTLTMVRVTTYGANELHCAVGKQSSSGGGSNVIPAACGTSQIQQTPCVSPRSGYPKATNGTGSTIIFSGIKWYNTCS